MGDCQTNADVRCLLLFLATQGSKRQVPSCEHVATLIEMVQKYLSSLPLAHSLKKAFIFFNGVYSETFPQQHLGVTEAEKVVPRVVLTSKTPYCQFKLQMLEELGLNRLQVCRTE